MTKVKTLPLVACAVLLVTLGLYAQQLNVGNITGSVTDPSGAVVPDAKVVAVNSGTNVAYPVVTTSAGLYSISLLSVGRYDVTVTKAGFEKATRSGVEVIAGTTFTVNFVLTVGATTQTITVTGAPPVLNATDTMQGTTRTLAEIQDLPISMEGNAEREAISSVLNMSGVNYSLQTMSGQGWMVVSRSAINGVYGGGFGYEIDGVEAGPGESEQGEDFMAPVPEAVQEVRMTSSTDAATGFNAGININQVMKSGTNQLHGSLGFYNRNGALEARPWFQAVVAHDNENQGTWTLGGPVYIPHVYDGRNKTFFFATMDVYRHITTNTSTWGFNSLFTVPTMAERTGDFQDQLGSQVGTDPLGNPVYEHEIYDPESTTMLANGDFVRTPFTYNGQLNVIPPNRLSSVSTYFANQYAAPNLPGYSNNWLGAYAPSNLPDQHYSVKIDQQIGDKQHLTFSLEREFGWFFPTRPPLCYGDHMRFSPGPLYTNTIISDQDSVDCRDEYRYRLNYTWTAKPDLLVSFNAGVTRDPKRNQVPAEPAELNGAALAGLTGTLSAQTPYVCFTYVSCFGTVQALQIWHSQRTPFSLDATWSKGKHLFTFGVQYIAAPEWTGGTENASSYSTQGSFGFSNNETGLPAYSYGPETGVDFASFMLGAVDGGVLATPWMTRLNASEAAVFAQDKWQLTHKLTVSYGVRWEITPPVHEINNEISSFDPSIPNPGAGGILGALSFWGTGPGRNGQTTVGPMYLKAFSPRIGLAYTITPKTVFRANYALSYFPYWAKWLLDPGNILPLDGFPGGQRSVSSLNSGWTPAFYWQSGVPITFPTLPDISSALDNGSGITYIDTNNNRPPYTENIGAEVERQLPSQILLRVAYVGNLEHRQYSMFSLNEMPNKYLALGNLLNDSISSPQAIAAGIQSPYPGFNGPVSLALTPYPQYAGGVSDLGGQLGNADYHSLQINVQRHFGSVTFLVNATFAKMMDMADQPYSCSATQAGLKSQLQTRQNAWSLASFDIPKQLNLNWYWDVPAGRGKRWLGNTNKAVSAALGGWRISGIQAYQSGMPIGIYADLNQGVPILAPTASGGCGSIQPNISGKDVYLNSAAFRIPPPFTLTNTSELPSVRGCGYFNEDLGLGKSFPFGFGEARRVSVGAIATNVFNRHQFIWPNTSITSPSFGQFSGSSYPRTLQLYAKITF